MSNATILILEEKMVKQKVMKLISTMTMTIARRMMMKQERSSCKH